MDNHTCSLPLTIAAILLCGLLGGTGARAQDNAYDTALSPMDAQSGSVVTSLLAPYNNDCYKGGRNRQIMLRVNDIASLWHYTTRILLPTNGTGMAPHRDRGALKTAQGLVWRVGANHGRVMVSASVDW